MPRGWVQAVSRTGRLPTMYGTGTTIRGKTSMREGSVNRPCAHLRAFARVRNRLPARCRGLRTSACTHPAVDERTRGRVSMAGLECGCRLGGCLSLQLWPPLMRRLAGSRTPKRFGRTKETSLKALGSWSLRVAVLFAARCMNTATPIRWCRLTNLGARPRRQQRAP